MNSYTAPIIAALNCEGLIATTADGRPAQFAIVDEDGKVIAAGPLIADAAWYASIAAYRKLLLSEGHIRVYTKVEALALNGQLEPR